MPFKKSKINHVDKCFNSSIFPLPLFILEFHIPDLKNRESNAKIFLEIVKKLCHLSGQWANRNGTADSERPDGWTGYLDQCLSGDSGMASAKSAEHNCWADFKSGFLFPILLFFLLFLLVVLFIIGITYLGRYCSKTKKLQKKQVPTAAGPSSVVV